MLLRFSVYGVKAQTPNLSLESCHFSHNGQQNFSIGKSLKYIEPGVSYTYEPPTSVAASISQNQKPSLGDWIKENRKPLRKGTLITGASGLVAGAVLLAIYLREKNDIENTDISSAPRKDIEQRITVNNRLLGISIGTFSLGVLGWGGFGLTFTIK